MKAFINFIREQGIVGLAIGFIMGASIGKVVSALVTDIINPIIGLLLGAVGDFKSASFHIWSAQILYGDFIGNLIDFIIICLVVYFGFKALKLENLDKKKETV